MGRSEVGIGVLFYLNWFSSPMSDTQLDSLLATVSSSFFRYEEPDFPDTIYFMVGENFDLLMYDLFSCKFLTEST